MVIELGATYWIPPWAGGAYFSASRIRKCHLPYPVPQGKGLMTPCPGELILAHTHRLSSWTMDVSRWPRITICCSFSCLATCATPGKKRLSPSQGEDAVPSLHVQLPYCVRRMLYDCCKHTHPAVYAECFMAAAKKSHDQILCLPGLAPQTIEPNNPLVWTPSGKKPGHEDRPFSVGRA